MSELLAIVERAQAHSQKKTENPNIDASENPSHELADNAVTKSNALSRAYYRFGLVEKRCMEALISKLHPQRSDNLLQEMELSAKEYAKTYQVSEKVAYRDISNAVEGIMHRVIAVDRPDHKPGKIEFTLMSKAEYKNDEGHISCAFNPYIVSHLIGMREKFSSYPLKRAVAFKSSYTWRFYELLVSWSQPKSKTGGKWMGWINKQSVDDLREMLGVPKSYTYGQFEKRCIASSIAELKTKAFIEVDFDRIKTNRRITHLDIRFIEDEQIQMKL